MIQAHQPNLKPNKQQGACASACAIDTTEFLQCAAPLEEAQDSAALVDAGIQHYELEGGQKKAKQLWQQAAALCSKEALHNLGVYYIHKGKVDKAMKHFNDAAAMGLGAAFCSLGKLYMHGLNNVEQDVEKGIKHYEAACELGEKSAYYYLGVYWLYQGDNKKALSLFEKLSLTHQNTAYYRGIIYCMIAGSGQYHKYQEAIHCLETACSIGSVYAHYTLAIMHYMGIGLQKDVIKGLKMLHAAAEDMDVTEALVELAHIYCSGCTEEEQEEETDCGGAKENNQQGLQQVILAVDYEKANEYLMRAAQKGSAEAMHFLGYNYEKGFGFDIDFESALYWYQQAAKLNYQASIDRLNELDD